jgi:hypothetical protein
MHYFIFPTKDSWISSGSSHIDGTLFTDQNFGKDPILEVKKEFFNLSFDFPTRALIDFSGNDFTEVSKSIVNGDITNPRFYLRLYEAEGNKELSTDYKLAGLSISKSWDEGRGKFGDNPKVTDGCSWQYTKYPTGGTAITWSNGLNNREYGTSIHTGSTDASQSFSNQSPDVEMDITQMAKTWLASGSNYGVLLRFSGSQETDETTFGHLKFFSKDTHTIYAPRIEVRWDDHKPATGSNTGSLLPLTMSGAVDNYLYMPELKESYKENEKVKFRVGCRKRYIQKSFSTSVQTISGSYFGESSGSYSILDVATGETMVPFSPYTSMSVDSTSNYFIQWLNGFYPDRIYKIIYRLKYADGQERIYDNNFEFTVKR